MNQVVVHGIVEPDGVLTLDQPIPLPPGDVEVTIQPRPHRAAPADSFWATMEQIWADQRARGHTPRNAEEIAALRQEAEEEMLEVERAHEECQQANTRIGRTEEKRG